jgi:thiamine biosynthesis lipoprotein
LRDEGLEHAIINAGGNVALVGDRVGDDFRVGIANPDDPTTARVIFAGSDINVVTSGDYQRFYTINGVRYSHIINPETLRPADMYRSITIIAEDGFVADFFSTECFMLEIEQIKQLAAEFDFEFIIIDNNHEVIVSEGIQDVVEIK